MVYSDLSPVLYFILSPLFTLYIGRLKHFVPEGFECRKLKKTGDKLPQSLAWYGFEAPTPHVLVRQKRGQICPRFVPGDKLKTPQKTRKPISDMGLKHLSPSVPLSPLLLIYIIFYFYIYTLKKGQKGTKDLLALTVYRVAFVPRLRKYEKAWGQTGTKCSLSLIQQGFQDLSPEGTNWGQNTNRTI